MGHGTSSCVHAQRLRNCVQCPCNIPTASSNVLAHNNSPVHVAVPYADAAGRAQPVRVGVFIGRVRGWPPTHGCGCGAPVIQVLAWRRVRVRVGVCVLVACEELLNNLECLPMSLSSQGGGRCDESVRVQMWVTCTHTHTHTHTHIPAAAAIHGSARMDSHWVGWSVSRFINHCHTVTMSEAMPRQPR